jgi:UDP:flavonoid glycosyltransferase YjiC (YdhE family)
MTMGSFKRILFFAEAVTLAHVARPIALAKGLDPRCYEIIMACHERYQRFIECEPWQTLPLYSIPSQQFLKALAEGKPVYDLQTLRDYVRDDLNLIEKAKPDLIVGDFRLSLSVSARLVGIPYISITSAYWSPYFIGNKYPLPVLPLTRILPIPIAEMLFRLVTPLVLSRHCEPLNRIRQENGLNSLGPDLREVYTDADYVLYADIPDLFPTRNLPTHHRYLGPVLWSAPVAKPPWWDNLPNSKPLIYLTLGSSGQHQLLPLVLQALANLPIIAIVAAAGANLPQYPPNAYVADYLPGREAAARANLVMCNGGSLTANQAIAAGVPVVGIAFNMDQFLNMDALVRARAATLIRADRINTEKIGAVVSKMLETPAFANNAGKLASSLLRYAAPKRFAGVVGEVLRS